MTVVPVGSGKIKIILNGRDVQMLGITVSSLDCSDPDTRQMLRALFKAAIKSAGLPELSDRLLIEAYPHKDGGGVLYFTQLQPSKNEKRLHMKPPKTPAYIYEFSDGGDLLNAVSRLYFSDLKNAGSRVYDADGKFLLILYEPQKNDPVLYEVMEFCNHFYKDPLHGRLINEHGTALTGEHAILEIGGALNAVKIPTVDA